MEPNQSEGTSNQGKRTRPLLLQSNAKVPRYSIHENSPPSTSLPPIVSPSSPKKMNIAQNDEIPPYGTLVPEKVVRKAGPYLLGPKLGQSPVKSIVQCLARKEKTDVYYQIKILSLKNEGQPETQDDRQGKMLMHTEFSLLSLLKDQDGVIHHHGLFKVIYLFYIFYKMANNSVGNFVLIY